MKKFIDIPKHVGVKITLFPDGQPHVTLTNIEDGDSVCVVSPIRNPNELFILMAVSDALDRVYARKEQLCIPYLMGARYDRLMHHGDSIDLAVVADAVNRCGFQRVNVLDVHSDVATALIKGARNINNRALVESYQFNDAILICPDAGAAKKVSDYLKWNPNIKDVVYCTKSRNIGTGEVTLTVRDSGMCYGKNCVVIDDICDGGATFLAIAKQIKPSHLTLIVTHGIFSKGFDALSCYFNKIITSNSYRDNYESSIVQTVDTYSI